MSAGATLRGWLGQHARAALGAAGQLRNSFAGSFMTIAAIGIALALPAAFMLIMANIEAATGDWDGAPRASLFLELGTPAADQQATAARVAELESVEAVRLIAPEQALAEFRASTGMDATLALLEANPLPPVVVATLAARPGAAAAERLVRQLEGLAHVEAIRLDRRWIERLDALIELANRAITLIALLLALSVVLVVGNTIRLDIENRRSEIEISKLIGGTDAFIRRPFLYTGMVYGLAGGLLAGVIIGIGWLLVAGPARRLAGLYQSSFEPAGPGIGGLSGLLLAGAALGLLGAWLAVARHLRAIEPH